MANAGTKDSNGVLTFNRLTPDLAYVAQSTFGDGTCKVGRSSDPERRIYSLEMGAPFKLRTVAVLLNGSARERAIKSALAHAQMRGEWFAPTALLNAILRDAHRDSEIVTRVAVDEEFHTAFILPALLKYVEGMKIHHNYGGDLIYRSIHEGFSTYKDRLPDLVAYTRGGVSAELAAGWIPLHRDMPAPQIVLPVNTGDPQVVSPAGA